MAPNLASSFCSQCGLPLPPADLVSLSGNPVCAACKPALLRRLQENGAADVAGSARYKGFWIRFLAYVLDGLVLDMVALPFALLFFIPFIRAVLANSRAGADPNASAALLLILLPKLILISLGSLFLVLGYRTWMVGRFGATIGKMAIGARIVTNDGGKVSYERALGRAAAEILTSMTFTIGYIIAGFDARKRALHDRIAGTLVVAQ